MDAVIAMLGPIAAGISLAAVAGLRAFLPLFVTGLAGRADWIPLGSGFEWLQSTPALIGFGSAVLAEILADKFPMIDNALDAVGMLVKPCAGMASMAALTADLDPFWRAALAIGVGGTVAGSVHFSKAKVRLGSTFATVGFGNPLISLAEDLMAVGGAVLALLWPALAVVILGLAGYLAYRLGRAVMSIRPRRAVSA